LLENLERQVLADRQVAAVFMAAGSKDMTLPTFAEKRALFDAALVEEPKPVSQVDSEQMELRRVLGVA
jgi:hypothetical protein